MLQPHLIYAILNEPWAIQPEWVSTYAHLIDGVFSKNLEFEKAEPTLPELVAASPFDNPNNDDATEVSNTPIQVSVIRITGAMTKYDQRCGPAGTATINSWLKSAIDNPDVDAIILFGDGPGGQVQGTETLASTCKSSTKPIVGFVDDMAASALFWVISQSHEIVANNTTAQIGSIGVLSTYQDMIPALEKAGVKTHIITAPQSENKTRLFDKIRAGDYEEYKEKVLRPLAAKFIAQVKASRPNMTDDQFKGDVYYAKDVVGSMIDHIGDFNFALQRAAALVMAQRAAAKQTLAHSNPINTMSKPDYNRLAKAAGVPQLESADGTITLSADMAAAVESALEASETQQAALQQQLTQRADQQSRITELENQIQSRDAEIATLKKGAGAESAAIETETETTAEGTDFWSIRAKLLEESKS